MSELDEPMIPVDNLEERQLTNAVPAIFANRVYALLDGGVMKISFGEQAVPGGVPKYRTAVVLRLEDAESLAGLITDLLGRGTGGAE